MICCSRGFTLLECLIYLLLVSGTALLVGMVGTNFFESHTKLFKKTDDMVTLSLVALHMARDIQRAPAARAQWEVAPGVLAWQGAEYHAWRLRDTKLLRTAGQEIAAVADGITGYTAELDLNSNGQVRGVSFVLEKGSQQLQRYVALYERIGLCSSLP